MIKWIHQNKHSVTVFLIGGIVILSMSIFSVDMTGKQGKQRYAIKIDDEEISSEQFQTEKRKRQQMLIERYKQMLGDNFNKFAQQINNIPNQQIIDGIIAENLFNKESKRLDLYLGEDEVVKVVRDQLFGGSFNASAYSAYLARLGMTPRAFEDQLRKELQIQNYRSLLMDVSYPSKLEINKRAERQETLYDIDYVEVDPAKYVSEVKAEDKELEAFFNVNQTDYEIPAKITYKYAILDPEKNLDLVEVTEDDIELFYSDNESNFMNPEEAKVSQIQISIPKDADPAKLEELKKKAEEAHAKAVAGENFASLVNQYSDDLATVNKGGDLGWLKKGVMTKDFDKEVFSQKTAGVTPLINTGFSYQVAKVEEFKEAQPKKLEAVKAEIKAALQKRDAPAFTSAKANEIFAVWSNNEVPLEETGKQNNLTLATSPTDLIKETDPDPTLKGLTQQVMQVPDEKKQIIELADKSILVEIINYQEGHVSTFEAAKPKVLEAYKKEQAKKIAKEKAQNVLNNLGTDANASLKKAAESLQLSVLEKKGVSRASNGEGVFAQENVRDNIFSTRVVLEKPKQVIYVDGKGYLFQVKAITPPKPEDLVAKIKTYSTEALNANSQILVESNLERLKSRAEIDVDQNIMASPKDVSDT